ncbi:MAG: 5-formyltetrahydrofolate cyclo-ligase, partial [Candidatus Margulisbacteria bacterium]|nr:5-formyltetrahydrofolate cyclo-ligase [Candidatus Margulisiibacteriota bacterium]
RGGGYYDKLLGHAKGLKVGIAYQDQIVTSLPTDDWDVQMDVVITNKDIRFY